MIAHKIHIYPLYLAGILYTLRCGEHEQPCGDKSSPAETRAAPGHTGRDTPGGTHLRMWRHTNIAKENADSSIFVPCTRGPHIVIHAGVRNTPAWSYNRENCSMTRAYWDLY